MSDPHESNPPARIGTDLRVAYYPSGLARVGPRKYRRHKTLEDAQAFAAAVCALRSTAGTVPIGERPHQTLSVAMRAYVEHRTKAGDTKSTTDQYRSNFNTWMPADIALTRCSELNLLHWNAIFSGALEEGASHTTIGAVARTLGSLIDFGLKHGYFPTEPFGEPRMKKAIVKDCRTRAANRDGRSERIELRHCPTPDDVDEYAAALESFYPGYGARLAHLTWACGGRINEMLGLRAGDLDPANLVVRIERQLNRSSAWPATKPPKNHRSRSAELWSFATETAESLIHDAGRPDAFLFPPLPGVTNWSDNLSHLATKAARSCSWKDRWSFHWLRHAYATYSLAPVQAGGFDLGVAAVQHSLGHATQSTTTDIYVHEVERDVDLRRAQTRRRPGKAT